VAGKDNAICTSTIGLKGSVPPARKAQPNEAAAIFNAIKFRVRDGD
jgi:hypothetical protein